MHLFAALVPPRDVLDHVAELLAGVRVEPERPGEPGRHAASSGRRFGRRRGQETTPAVQPIGPLLDLVPPVRMHVPIARFGHLALTDATRLTTALEQQASEWRAPRLYLHGGAALEPEGDISVWVGIGGDLDELNAVVRNLSRVAQGLHLFVDRRVFRPDVQLGTVNDETTEAYLEEVLATLETYRSRSWQAALSLLIPMDLGPDRPPYKVHRDLPLGPAVQR